MNSRIVVAALSLSAAAFIGIVGHESYTDEAVIPTQNDRPTLGYGSTFHEDGRPVKLGDRTNPVRALIIAKTHIGKEEVIFRQSLAGASLHQAEFDIYMDWVYQYGTGAWVTSSMRREILAGRYKQACDSLLLYKRSGGYDCSTLINGRPNKRCWGVWTRQLERHAACVAAQ